MAKQVLLLIAVLLVGLWIPIFVVIFTADQFFSQHYFELVQSLSPILRTLTESLVLTFGGFLFIVYVLLLTYVITSIASTMTGGKVEDC